MAQRAIREITRETFRRMYSSDQRRVFLPREAHFSTQGRLGKSGEERCPVEDRE